MKDIQELRHDLREGVIAFPVTPFHAHDLSLDLDGYRTGSLNEVLPLADPSQTPS